MKRSVKFLVLFSCIFGTTLLFFQNCGQKINSEMSMSSAGISTVVSPRPRTMDLSSVSFPPSASTNGIAQNVQFVSRFVTDSSGIKVAVHAYSLIGAGIGGYKSCHS
jgi:hypothetical protein